MPIIHPDTRLLDAFIALAGYIENGSDTVVTFFQDDATKDWCLNIGQGTHKRRYFAGSPREVIRLAAQIDENALRASQPALNTFTTTKE